jgi:hypothetical protein
VCVVCACACVCVCICACVWVGGGEEEGECVCERSVVASISLVTWVKEDKASMARLGLPSPLLSSSWWSAALATPSRTVVAIASMLCLCITLSSHRPSARTFSFLCLVSCVGACLPCCCCCHSPGRLYIGALSVERSRACVCVCVCMCVCIIVSEV